MKLGPEQLNSSCIVLVPFSFFKFESMKQDQLNLYMQTKEISNNHQIMINLFDLADYTLVSGL